MENCEWEMGSDRETRVCEEERGKRGGRKAVGAGSAGGAGAGSIAIGAILQAALDLTIRLGLGDGIPLIVQLFTAAQADLDLEAGALEIDLQRDQGIALLGSQTRELHEYDALCGRK